MDLEERPLEVLEKDWIDDPVLTKEWMELEAAINRHRAEIDSLKEKRDKRRLLAVKQIRKATEPAFSLAEPFPANGLEESRTSVSERLRGMVPERVRSSQTRTRFQVEIDLENHRDDCPFQFEAWAVSLLEREEIDIEPLREEFDAIWAKQMRDIKVDISKAEASLAAAKAMQREGNAKPAELDIDNEAMFELDRDADKDLNLRWKLEEMRCNHKAQQIQRWIDSVEGSLQAEASFLDNPELPVDVESVPLDIASIRSASMKSHQSSGTLAFEPPPCA